MFEDGSTPSVGSHCIFSSIHIPDELVKQYVQIYYTQYLLKAPSFFLPLYSS